MISYKLRYTSYLSVCEIELEILRKQIKCHLNIIKSLYKYGNENIIIREKGGIPLVVFEN